MKKIAITQRFTRDKATGEERDALDRRWGELFNYLGWHMVVIPSAVSLQSFFECAGIEGIILSGGNDLSCVAPDDNMSRRRDAHEYEVLEYAMSNRLPVLGVCRGMQLMATYFGAELSRIESHVNQMHPLTWTNIPPFLKNSTLPATVNSFHNYAVKNIPSVLEITAVSDDECIEAIYHKTFRLFGIMWHPEREASFVSSQCEMLSSFFHD